MASTFYTLRGEVDAFVDAGYDRPVKGDKNGKTEHIDKYRLMLLIPGTSDLVSVNLPVEVAPKTPEQEKYEDDRQWVEISAEKMTHMKGETDGRAWSMISFDGVDIKPLGPADMKAIAAARRAARNAKKAADAKKKADAKAAAAAEAAKK